MRAREVIVLAGDYTEQAPVTNWPGRIALVLVVLGLIALALGRPGMWLEREGARDLFIPAGAIVAVRADRVVAGTARARDSVIVLTRRLGEASLDTGFRADETTGHGTVLDGLTATFAVSAGEAGDQ